MTMIIASFKQRSDAVGAVNALRQAGFTMGAKMPLAIDPEFEVSAEPAVSAGAEDSGPSAGKGAAIGSVVGMIAGVALTPLVGPAGVIAGAGVGAYTGSLVGALSGLEEPKNPAAAEEGALLKVAVAGAAGKARAIEILTTHGAAHVTEETSVPA